MHPTETKFTRAALIGVLASAALFLSGCGDPGGDDTDTTTPPAGSAPAGSAATEAAAPAGSQAAVQPAQGSSSQSDADQAWENLQREFSEPPSPPASWADTPPTEEEVREFERSRGAAAVKVADAARDFYTRFGDDPRSDAARWHEMQLLDAAVKLGVTNVLERLETAEADRMKDPNVGEEERFGVRMAAAQREAEMLFAKDPEEAREKLTSSLAAIAREFPQRPETYQLLLSLASSADAEKARPLIESILSTNTPEPIRMAASNLLARFEMVGKPLDLKFSAVDGREIDLAAMRGKVVLIDFWATWCGPCIVELPNVKAAYEKLHPQGFEILGISFDQDKDELTQFVASNEMPWPQYFDGKGWENDIGRRFGIQSIPTMWLVDKNGVLRDLNARANLEQKVADLLAEEPGGSAGSASTGGAP